jgi:hypothetical protein
MQDHGRPAQRQRYVSVACYHDNANALVTQPINQAVRLLAATERIDLPPSPARSTTMRPMRRGENARNREGVILLRKTTTRARSITRSHSLIATSPTLSDAHARRLPAVAAPHP